MQRADTAATTAPAKRHHSQISMPLAASSSNAISNNKTTDHRHNNSNSNGRPFENFMQMFGNALQRPRQQRPTTQQQSQSYHQQQQPRQTQPQRTAWPSRPSHRGIDHDERRASLPTHQPKQARQRPPASDCDRRTNSSVRVPSVSVRDGTSCASSAPLRSAPAPAPTSVWRTALCPRSHKPYYWNVQTRESRWKKPLELASEEERAAIEGKERKQREFFECMERNILKKLEGGKRPFDDGGRDGGAVKEGADGRVGCSVSPVVADDGINQSWTQVASADNDKVNEDWITGWITPGSSDTTQDRCYSPSCGSLSSIEGLSVLDPNSGFSPGTLSTSLTSLTSTSSLSREERDDRVLPLNGKAKMSKLERIKSASSRPVIDKPDLIRTISKMEYDLAYQLNPSLRRVGTPETALAKRVHGSDREAPITPTGQTCDILSSLHLTLDGEGLNISLVDDMAREGFPNAPASPLTPVSLDDCDLPERSLSSPDVEKPSLAKRNTCGTIYLGSTLSAPDKDALIKCVCGVFRAHLLQTETAAPGIDEATLIFHDRRAPGDYRPLDTTSVPTLSQITDFYRSIFLRSQMEVDCIIISLIYVERLIKMTKGALTPRARNWRSVLFSCMVLASKVWDDLSMWNCDFSKIGPSGVTFSLARTNELEIALLRALEYRVKVNASEYAKYYFLLRGMLCRSGLANDALTRLRPLDVKGAQTLEATGEKKAVAKPSMKERSKTYGCVEMAVDRGGSESSEDASEDGAPPQSSPTSKRVTLEQIVRM